MVASNMTEQWRKTGISRGALIFLEYKKESFYTWTAPQELLCENVNVKREGKRAAFVMASMPPSTAVIYSHTPI